MDTERQSAYQEELDQLDQVTRLIDDQLRELEAIPRYYGTDLTEQVLESIRENGRRSLARARPEPYFGRLDWQEKDSEAPAPLYIGKVGVENRATGQPLVIDWRAPVASLFYSFTGGADAASYDSPEGLVEGLVYLKRNLVIRKQLLQRVVDTYTRGGDNLAVADEFLLYRLGENKDNRLRDIVSTIQSEQDSIIRAVKNQALLIQGVAGSGKTTVALHRLAYLLYQYREQIRAERMIIFAPNSMFLDYISGVLPELGVGDIQQTTFTDWALEQLDHEVKLADPAKTHAYWFASGTDRPAITDETPGRFKGALAFRELLDACLDHYEAVFLPDADFEAAEDLVLPVSLIRRWFTVENKHYPLAKRRERTLARIKRWLEMQLEQMADPVRRKDKKAKASARLRAYAKAWPAPSPLTFYTQLFRPAKRTLSFPEELLSRIPETVAEETAKTLKKKQAQWEDLAPLVYIRDRFEGIGGNDTFDHTVIDEAQDFSPFQVALLDRHTKGSSFTILGDLSQGIHGYQGIISWDEFAAVFGDGQSAYYQLDRSYRSTMEIIRFANQVLANSGGDFPQAVPVFRSGDKVKLVPASRGGTAAQVLAILAKLAEGPAETIAVMTRSEKRSRELHAALEAAGREPSLIQAGQREYRGGLSVLPVYLAKGLEFDAVVLVDADEAHYAADPQDGKLLYVGCTRALHDLWVVYEGSPTRLIRDAGADVAETAAAASL
ncbi:DNA helicase [Paenibacillus sp. J31TS4]|uniref:HelD family protein n=1 Tax=Paenibacillus sp. J31TS4 TaxID=2807195 RepID=UPI001B1CD5A6|nr:ATP-binding domain-containing protein [Paenibacillus sp. J31TS4]GIP41040.1 DNA helicase [Paenibacillus sp. J31TS4]